MIGYRKGVIIFVPSLSIADKASQYVSCGAARMNYLVPFQICTARRPLP